MQMECTNTQCTIGLHQEALRRILVEFDRVCSILDISYMLFAGTMLGAVRHGDFIPWDDDLDVIMLREDYERFLREADAYLNRDIFFLQKEYSEHWPMFFSKLRLNNTACLEKYHPKDPLCHQGVYMDIFPCDNGCNTLLGRKIQFFASKILIAKSLDRRGYSTDSWLKKCFMMCCRILPQKPFLAIVKGPKRKAHWVHSFLGGASSFEKNVYSRAVFEKTVRMAFGQEKYPVSAYYDALLKQLYGDYMQMPPVEKRLIKQHALLVDLEHSYEDYLHYRDGMKFEVHTRSIR